jgi:hypothetical protein
MKPSEDAPITCGLLLADVLTEAGLPAGVLNVVTNDLADAGDVVAALIADPRVRMVNFTGSTNVGRIIGVQAAQHLKPAVLELGGKNPLIILEDADPDLAVDAAVFGAFMNSGQLCMSTDRIIDRRGHLPRPQRRPGCRLTLSCRLARAAEDQATPGAIGSGTRLCPVETEAVPAGQSRHACLVRSGLSRLVSKPR